MIIDTNPFSYTFYMGGAPRWVLLINHQHQPLLMTTAVVSGKSPQYTTTKGFPWSWTSFMSLFLSPSNHMIMDLCQSVTCNAPTTACVEVVPSSVPKANIT
jgi:hypothetical protein